MNVTNYAPILEKTQKTSRVSMRRMNSPSMEKSQRRVSSYSNILSPKPNTNQFGILRRDQILSHTHKNTFVPKKAKKYFIKESAPLKRFPSKIEVKKMRLNSSRSQEIIRSPSVSSSTKNIFYSKRKNEKISFMKIKQSLPIVTVKYKRVVKEDQKRVILKRNRSMSSSRLHSHRSSYNSHRISMGASSRFVRSSMTTPRLIDFSRTVRASKIAEKAEEGKSKESSTIREISSDNDDIRKSEVLGRFKEMKERTKDATKKNFFEREATMIVEEEQEDTLNEVEVDIDGAERQSLKDFLDDNCFYKQAQETLSDLNKQLTSSIKNSETVFKKAMQYLTPNNDSKQQQEQRSTDTNEKQINKEGSEEKVFNTVELSLGDNFCQKEDSVNYTPIFRMMSDENSSFDATEQGLLIKDFENDCLKDLQGDFHNTQNRIDFFEEKRSYESVMHENIVNLSIPMNYSSNLKPINADERISIRSKTAQFECIQPKRRLNFHIKNLPNDPSDKFSVTLKNIHKTSSSGFEFNESINKISIQRSDGSCPQTYLKSFLSNIDDEIANINNKITNIVDILNDKTTSQKEEDKYSTSFEDNSQEDVRVLPRRSPSPQKVFFKDKKKLMNQKKNKSLKSTKKIKQNIIKEKLKTIKIDLSEIKNFVNTQRKVEKQKKLGLKTSRFEHIEHFHFKKVSTQQLTKKRMSHTLTRDNESVGKFSMRTNSIVPNLGHPKQNYKLDFHMDMRSRSLTTREDYGMVKDAKYEEVFDRRRRNENMDSKSRLDAFKDSIMWAKFGKSGMSQRAEILKNDGVEPTFGRMKRKKKKFLTKNFQMRQEKWLHDKENRILNSIARKKIRESEGCTFKPRIKKFKNSKKRGLATNSGKKSARVHENDKR